ncbi:MAG: acyl--CoA ligase [Maledivibacter sp.]|nr:acyl--CoA ligase [Maledivibacter sp.]
MKNNWGVGNYSLFRSRISPEREAVYDYDNKIHYTYGDLENRANLLANYMVEKLNVKKGDRVAFCTRNCMELIDAYYATAKTGAIFVTYNLLLSENELVEMINNEEPKVLFYEELIKNKIGKIKSETKIQDYIVLSNAKGKIEDIHYEEIMNYKNNAYREEKDLDIEDIHMLIHTGGTTGIPKGAKISHESLIYNSMASVLTFNLSHLDSTFILTPMFHTAGWSVLNLPHLHVGGRIIISKMCDPKLTLKIINEQKPTTLLGVSTIFRMMINQSEFETTDFSSLRWIISAAAPTPIDIMKKFWGKGVKFVIAYGMTEAGPCNLTIQADDMNIEQIRSRYNSVGRPMYFTQVKIVDNEGNEVGVNECGEIIWSGPGIFSGYWNNEKDTSEILRDGWVYTGDIAKKDEDGFYYIVGRKKNMFITGGENIFPPEIEAEIYKHPSIHEVCVIGIPDKKWGEVGKAVITLKQGENIDTKELKEFLDGKIGSIKIPKYVQVIEEIPKNSTGKIQIGVISRLYGKAE